MDDDFIEQFIGNCRGYFKAHCLAHIGVQDDKIAAGRPFERMKKIYADEGYRCGLEENVENDFGLDMEITLRSDKSTEFKPLPKRWVVERTFSWLENFRRSAKDYGYKVSTNEAMPHPAFITLMLNRIYSQ